MFNAKLMLLKKKTTVISRDMKRFVMSACYINNAEAICKFIQLIKNIPDWLPFLLLCCYFLLKFFSHDFVVFVV